MTKDERRALLEGDLWMYARFVLPHYSFGDIHKDVFRLIGAQDRAQTKPNILALIPRDHLDSPANIYVGYDNVVYKSSAT